MLFVFLLPLMVNKDYQFKTANVHKRLVTPCSETVFP